MPRAAIIRGVFDLMPRSSAATVNFFVPMASTTYGLSVVTSTARFAPTISAEALTCSTMDASSVSSEPENTPARMAPRSRMWRVRVRVSRPAMPTTPWFVSSSSRPRFERQFDGVRAGSRTT
jgi:hypothetical protein